MATSTLASARVVDANGQTVASSTEAPSTTEAGELSFPLPGGGALVVSPRADASWERLSRAFVHELRSPLNALVLYLELLGERRDATAKPELAPERIAGKAQDQVRRVDELLRTFGTLFAPRAHGSSDLAAMLRSTMRFAKHDATRLGFRLDATIVPDAPVQADALLAVEAVVRLYGSLCGLPDGAAAKVSLVLEGGEAVLTATADHALADADELRAAFARAGARAEVNGGHVRAAFALT